MIKTVKRIIIAYLVYCFGKKYVIPNQEKLAQLIQKQSSQNNRSKDEDWGPTIIKIEKGDKTDGN